MKKIHLKTWTMALVFFVISFTRQTLAGPELDMITVSPVFLKTNVEDFLECSTEQNLEIAEINNEMIGIKGGDPDGDYIGFAPAKKSWVGRNWYPLDGNRKTLCGRFDRFSAWEGARIRVASDERDWNIFITPHENFSWLIDDALARVEGDDSGWHRCDDQLCIEVEVTPPSVLNDYWAFSYMEGRSRLIEGQDLCTYGPWVSEESHDDRPEIHPSELLWWEGTSGEKYMVIVLDASDRFDESINFRDEPSRGWKPWAAAPIVKEFKIAFDTELGVDIEQYELDIGRQESVRTASNPAVSQDASTGRRHAIEMVGNSPILVVETAMADPLLGVQFESVCYNSSTKRLKGYIVVKAKVGRRDYKGGFLEIILSKEIITNRE